MRVPGQSVRRKCGRFLAVAALLTLLIAAVGKTAAGDEKQEKHILIDLNEHTLVLYVDGQAERQYPVAIGTGATPTPVGEWKITSKGLNWGGGFGTRWLGFNAPWGIYGIHGTNRPGSIGQAVSHGCVRMQNADVEALYPLVDIGTRVFIVGPLPERLSRWCYRPGQTGQEIVALQLALRQAGFAPGYADARFGEQTEKAVRELECCYGLTVDGTADGNVLVLLGLR